MRVFLLVDPATMVLGRLAESGLAFRALALTVIFLAGIIFVLARSRAFATEKPKFLRVKADLFAIRWYGIRPISRAAK